MRMRAAFAVLCSLHTCNMSTCEHVDMFTNHTSKFLQITFLQIAYSAHFNCIDASFSKNLIS